MKAYAVTDNAGRRLIAGMSLADMSVSLPLRASEEPIDICKHLSGVPLGKLIGAKRWDMLARFVMQSEECLATKLVMHGSQGDTLMIRCNRTDYFKRGRKIFSKRRGE